jgi:plastocyanin
MALTAQQYFRVGATTMLVSFAVACGSYKGTSPTSPSGQMPTVTISATGVSPSVTHISTGQQVQFVNSDNQNHQINSDPFPADSDCPPINDVGMLAPGQSKTTGMFSSTKSCGFHDNLNQGAKNLQGQILVDTSQPAPGYGGGH